jgi:glycosyltransferase involved in cell wall biosynthesis
MGGKPVGGQYSQAAVKGHSRKAIGRGALNSSDPEVEGEESGVIPKVSVIIPVFNGAKYLAEALQSVFSQTFRDYEVIVVDDASSDNSVEVSRRFAHVRIARQEHRGQSAARNTGVSYASGEYVAFLDQDDRWYPDKLARQVPVLEEGRRYGMVYSNADEIDEHGRIMRVNLLDITSVHPKESITDCLSSDMFILPGTVLIRKALFERLGGFDERLSGYEDDDLFRRVFEASRIHYIPDALLQWRIYPTSYSYSERMDRSRRIYVQKLFEEYPDRARFDRHYIRDSIAPRFVQTYLILYSLSLRESYLPSKPEHYRDQVAALFPYLRWPNPLIWLVAHLPVPVTRLLQRLWRPMPSWLQSPFWRPGRPSASAQDRRWDKIEAGQARR